MFKPECCIKALEVFEAIGDRAAAAQVYKSGQHTIWYRRMHDVV
jgi:hypothetical protein